MKKVLQLPSNIKISHRTVRSNVTFLIEICRRACRKDLENLRTCWPHWEMTLSNQLALRCTVCSELPFATFFISKAVLGSAPGNMHDVEQSVESYLNLARKQLVLSIWYMGQVYLIQISKGDEQEDPSYMDLLELPIVLCPSETNG